MWRLLHSAASSAILNEGRQPWNLVFEALLASPSIEVHTHTRKRNVQAQGVF